MIEKNQLLMINGLKRVSYEYIRDVVSVSDLEMVKRELNEDRSIFVVHNDDSYTIGENEEVSRNYTRFLDYLLPTSDSAVTAALYENDASSLANPVYIFEKNDMGIVRLTWQYKGETLNTMCLVSEKKGFVFDKILFAIPFEVQNQTEEESSTSSKLQLKSTPPPPPDGPIEHTDSYFNYYANMAGVLCWEYEITVTLHGQLIAGIKYATSPNLSYRAYGLGKDDPAHYLFGTWDCKADARILDFKQGPEGYLLNAYAWTHKHNRSVIISWNGTGFVFTGGGTTGGGSKGIPVDDSNETKDYKVFLICWFNKFCVKAFNPPRKCCFQSGLNVSLSVFDHII